MTDKIRECPFCGGEARMHQISTNNFSVHCIDASGKCPTRINVVTHRTEEQALKAWNTRAAVDGGLVEALKGVDVKEMQNHMWLILSGNVNKIGTATIRIEHPVKETENAMKKAFRGWKKLRDEALQVKPDVSTITEENNMDKIKAKIDAQIKKCNVPITGGTLKAIEVRDWLIDLKAMIEEPNNNNGRE